MFKNLRTTYTIMLTRNLIAKYICIEMQPAKGLGVKKLN